MVTGLEFGWGGGKQGPLATWILVIRLVMFRSQVLDWILDGAERFETGAGDFEFEAHYQNSRVHSNIAHFSRKHDVYI